MPKLEQESRNLRAARPADALKKGAVGCVALSSMFHAYAASLPSITSQHSSVLSTRFADTMVAGSLDAAYALNRVSLGRRQNVTIRNVGSDHNLSAQFETAAHDYFDFSPPAAPGNLRLSADPAL